jgi:Putative amidoligase enzyme
MKFDDINPIIIQPVQLDEVNMSPSALKKFTKSTDAAGIQAGFEAELIFREHNDSSGREPEYEPDYESDEPVRSIDDIIEFYSNGDFSDLSGNHARRVRDELFEEYFEWRIEQLMSDFGNEDTELVRQYIEENNWDEDEEIRNALEEAGTSEEEIDNIMNAMDRRNDGKGTAADKDLVEAYVAASERAKEKLEEMAEESIENNDENWDGAWEEFQSNSDDYSQDDWLRSIGRRYARNWEGEHDLMWPHYINIYGDEGGEGEYNVDDAQYLADSLEEALGVTVQVQSGYHQSRKNDTDWYFEPDGSLSPDENSDLPVEIVSPPMDLNTCLEMMPKFFKWAESQGAYANQSTGFHMSVSMPEHTKDNIDFVKLALFLGDKHVLEQFGRSSAHYTPSALKKIEGKIDSIDTKEAFNKMRTHMSELASKAIASSSGFGKYASINPKENYIEFRSAGGEDYFADMDKIQNTLMRYARALEIASDPKADREEYAKKLYKLIKEKTPDDDSINKVLSYFARYSAKEIPAAALKSFIKQEQSKRETQRQIDSGTLSKDYDPNGEYVIRKKENGEPVGPILHRFSATGTSAAISMATDWGAERGLDRSQMHLAHIDNVPPEILNARTAGQTDATVDRMPPINHSGNFEIYSVPSDASIYPFSAENEEQATAVLELWRRTMMTSGLNGANYRIRRNPDAAQEEPRSYIIYDRDNNTSILGFMARSSTVANERFQRYRQDHPNDNVDLRYADDATGPSVATSPVETEPQNFPAASDPTGNYVLRRREGNEGVGPVLYRFRAADTGSAIRAARQWTEARNIERQSVYLDSVSNLTQEELRAT